MICAPASSSIAWVRALTVPCVPTGMKTGVSMAPCAVVSRPLRASLAGSAARLSKVKGLFMMNRCGDRTRLRVVTIMIHLARQARDFASGRRKLLRCFVTGPGADSDLGARDGDGD